MGTTTKRMANLVEKTILGFVAGAAGAIGVLETVFLVRRVAELAASDPTTISGVRLAEPVPADVGGSAAVVSAEYDTVTLVIEGLSDAARGALIAAIVLGSLLTIGICMVLVWLCLRVFVGKPFVRSATWGVAGVAILVLLAGLVAPFLRGIASTEAVAQVGADGALLIAELNLAPLGWASALIVIAGAFEIGQRLQRDTEALV
ncbi:MAG: hypothetical protein WBL06_00830 [Pseudolysinimonas sp.]|uniref:hypothetical protein n=1 Tax=Pseudolysinimonas sp. TaxID=2680009 RepID=UPI003C77CC56